MISLFPVKIEVAEPEIKDYNFKLATYLKEYIEKRDGEAKIARQSASAPEVNPCVVKESDNPEVFIRFTDGYTGGGRYVISCDAYSALAGSINNELNSYWGAPSGSGLNITGTLSFSQFNDIEIGFDKLDDLIEIVDPGDPSADPPIPPTYGYTKLENLAKRIVEASYWYPIKTLKDTDKPHNNDPYMYRFESTSTWHESTQEFKKGQNYNGSKGTLEKDDSDPEHIIRFLKIESSVTGDYSLEQIGEKDPEPSPEPSPEPQPKIPIMDTPVPQHYTWAIPITDWTPAVNKIVFTAKGETGGETIYVKIGKANACYYLPHTEYPPAPVKDTGYIEFTDTATTEYKEFTFDIPSSLSEVTSLEVGVQGSGTVNFTAVWVTEEPDKYNKYPQGYRDEIEPETQTTVPTEPIPALTLADNLLDRAQDKIGTPEPQPEQETSESPTGGESPSSPEGFGNALGGIMDQLTNQEEGVGGVIDLNSVMKIDTKAMLDQVKNELDFTKKLNLSKAMDKLEGLKSGAMQQAEALISVAKDKASGLAGALTKEKLAGASSIALPKTPTADALAGASAIKDQAKALADSQLKNVNQLKDGLKAKTADITASATKAMDTVNTAKNAIAQAKNAASNATNTVKASINSVQVNTGGLIK